MDDDLDINAAYEAYKAMTEIKSLVFMFVIQFYG
jgi:hypothetical protein